MRPLMLLSAITSHWAGGWRGDALQRSTECAHAICSGGKAGTLKPLDALRWIRTRDGSAEAWNVRDLGGWACDGGTVKYGLLIRGGRISAADRAVLVGQFGVQHEIDLRGKEGRDPSDGDVATESPLVAMCGLRLLTRQRPTR